MRPLAPQAALWVFLVLALPAAAVRKEAIQSLHLDAGQVSRNEGHLLPWSATAQEGLGFEVELVFGPVVNAMLWPVVVDQAVHGISQGLQKEGVKSSVQANACRCTKYVQGKGYVMPLLFGIQGVENFDAFNKKSLVKVKAKVLQHALHGVPGPGGVGYAKDGEPVEARLLKHPEVGDALKSFALSDTDSSGLQLSMAVELWGGKLAEHEGAADPLVLMEKMWEKITGIFWQTLYDGGVDARISSRERAEDPLPQSAAEAKALTDQGASACILPPSFHAALGADDGQVSLWKGAEKGQDFFGLRAVISFISVNANINTQLADMRNDIMKALMSEDGEDLAGKLQAYRTESNAVPCGWTPQDASEAPFPHDAAPCATPPTF